MKTIAVALALVAGPVAAQQLMVDSTFDAFSKTSRVCITSEALPAGLPGLDVYVTARVVIARSTDSYLPYTATCQTWVGFSQQERGEYWVTQRVPIDLLVRRPGRTPGARLAATTDGVMSIPSRERPGDLAFRLTPQRQAAVGITAQLHKDASTAFFVEFPGEFFDAAKAVLARADSALMIATKANRIKEPCR